jgi:hypothetical protein
MTHHHDSLYWHAPKGSEQAAIYLDAIAAREKIRLSQRDLVLALFERFDLEPLGATLALSDLEGGFNTQGGIMNLQIYGDAAFAEACRNRFKGRVNVKRIDESYAEYRVTFRKGSKEAQAVIDTAKEMGTLLGLQKSSWMVASAFEDLYRKRFDKPPYNREDNWGDDLMTGNPGFKELADGDLLIVSLKTRLPSWNQMFADLGFGLVPEPQALRMLADEAERKAVASA